jgi:hypothetical protein
MLTMAHRYFQLTGKDWDRQPESYHAANEAWRRLCKDANERRAADRKRKAAALEASTVVAQLGHVADAWPDAPAYIKASRSHSLSKSCMRTPMVLSPWSWREFLENF